MSQKERGAYIQKELMKYFQESSMNLFYTFIKTPKGRQLICFNPQEGANPRTFYVNFSEIRKACPQLSRHQYCLQRTLTASGMLSKRINHINWKWSIGHQTLTIHSTKQEIYQAWRKGECEGFMKSICLLSRIYKSLQTKDSKVYWNQDGSEFTLKANWHDYGDVSSFFQSHGFSQLNSPSFSHPLIRRELGINPWLLIWLKTRRMKHKQRRVHSRNNYYIEEVKKKILLQNARAKSQMQTKKNPKTQQKDSDQSLEIIQKDQYLKDSKNSYEEILKRSKILSTKYKMSIRQIAYNAVVVLGQIQQNLKKVNLERLSCLFDQFLKEQISESSYQQNPTVTDMQQKKSIELMKLYRQIEKMGSKIGELESEINTLRNQN